MLGEVQLKLELGMKVDISILSESLISKWRINAPTHVMACIDKFAIMCRMTITYPSTIQYQPILQCVDYFWFPFASSQQRLPYIEEHSFQKQNTNITSRQLASLKTTGTPKWAN